MEKRVKSAIRLIEGQVVRVPPSQQTMLPPLIMTRMRHAPAALKQGDIDEDPRLCYRYRCCALCCIIFLAVNMTRTFST